MRRRNLTRNFLRVQTVPPSIALDTGFAASLPPLDVRRTRWQTWLSGALSLGLLIAVLLQLRHFGFARAWATMPGSLLFWITFAGYYLALPASEWIIFRRLWNLPAGSLAALLRKLVSNEVLLGYSGEASFYAWARQHARLVAAPFGAIKDVSILSALAGNLVTLVMLAVAWPLLRAVAPEFHARSATVSASLIILMSVVLLLFRKRLFSLPLAELKMIFGVHMGRLAVTTLLSGALWHIALPEVPLILLVLLATLQLLVTRLPLIPSKDLVFAGLAAFLIGHDAAVAALITMTAAAILATHLAVGGVLAVAALISQDRL